MNCPKCHQPLGNGATYCVHCGVNISILRIPSETVIIGRLHTVDHYIDDPLVSGLHASLTAQGDGLFLLNDLGSANGTAVNFPLNTVKRALVTGSDVIYLAGKPYKVSQLLIKNAKHTEFKTIFKKKAKITIGRTPKAEIFLDDPSVSRNQAVLVSQSDGTWVLTDCNSKNGTFVDGQKVRTAPINFDNLITFGKVNITLQQLLVKSIQKLPLSPAKSLLYHILPRLLILFFLGFLVWHFYGQWSAPLKNQPLPPTDGGQISSDNNLAVPKSDPVQPAAPTEKPIAPSNTEDVGQNNPVLSESEINEMTRKATVLVLTEKGQGSGFFIGTNLVMTNAHVVGSKGQDVLVANREMGFISATVIASRLSTEASSQVEDYAVLRVSRSVSVTPLVFATAAKTADKVFIWGYPGLPQLLDTNKSELPEANFNSGVINEVKKNELPPLILHSASTTFGNSGSALLNEKGQVIGLNTGVLPDQRSNYQSNISLASIGVINFLRANSIPFKLEN